MNHYNLMVGCTGRADHVLAYTDLLVQSSTDRLVDFVEIKSRIEAAHGALPGLLDSDTHRTAGHPNQIGTGRIFSQVSLPIEHRCTAPATWTNRDCLVQNQPSLIPDLQALSKATPELTFTAGYVREQNGAGRKAWRCGADHISWAFDNGDVWWATDNRHAEGSSTAGG